jgi:DNA-binding NarL/FixJ family response regulator
MNTDTHDTCALALPANVLIADDDPRVRAALRALIEAESDIAVVGEAGTPYEVLEQTTRLAPSAIILDLLLPRAVDGLNLLRHLAHQQARPIIAISARGGLREEAISAGATAFLEKGCATDLLIDALHDAIRSTQDC